MNAGPPRSILFADVVGSTALYRSLGDARAEALIRASLARFERIVAARGGRLVKTIGDCAMCDLPTPDAAGEAAMELQRVSSVPAVDGESPLYFRVGFTHGAVVRREDGDVFGDAVNVAARLCDMAQRGQILTTQATGESMHATLAQGLRVFDQAMVKGVEQPITVMQLLWDRRAATQIFIAPQAELAAAGDEPLLRLRCGGSTVDISARQLPFTLGRDPACGLIVSSPCVSRMHARIERHRGKLVLIDESTNGTYVLPAGTAPERPLYLRRESFTLIDQGVFALGERPNAPGITPLHYEVL